MAHEGRQLTDKNAAEIADWCGGRTAVQHSLDDDATPIIGVNVPVGDEVQRAQPGDYVVRSHGGTFSIKKLPTVER